jgi:hypothetical protein
MFPYYAYMAIRTNRGGDIDIAFLLVFLLLAIPVLIFLIRYLLVGGEKKK